MDWHDNHILEREKTKLYTKIGCPDPTHRIMYDDKFITKTKIPDDISVEWKHDYEANVILTKQGREPDSVKVELN